MVFSFFSKWIEGEPGRWLDTYVEMHICRRSALSLTSSFHSPDSGVVVWKESERLSGVVAICSTSQSRGYTVLFSPLRESATVPTGVSISTPSAHQRYNCFLLQFITLKLNDSKVWGCVCLLGTCRLVTHVTFSSSLYQPVLWPGLWGLFLL